MTRSMLGWSYGVFLLSSLWLQPFTWAKDPGRASIILTSRENGLENESEFSCRGIIHGYIRLPRREVGRHRLSSRWITPAHKVAAESQVFVDFRPARSTAYVWFSFPNKGGLAGMPDPAVDAQQAAFSGDWRLEVAWDNQPLLSAPFTVRCR